MKTFVTLLAILLAMVFVVPAFAGEEPFKAAVWSDDRIPDFYISEKLDQFTHPNTAYYDTCGKWIAPNFPDYDFTACSFNYRLGLYWCPAKCSEKFTSNGAMTGQPQVCCTDETKYGDAGLTAEPRKECPDDWCGDSVCEASLDETSMDCRYTDWCKTSLISKGNGGTFEWVIALPKKPEGELNIEIECGVLKGNSFEERDYDAIEECAAITGEPVASNCTRQAGVALRQGAMPKLTAIAYPGCLNKANPWQPFHLTAYRNPGTYVISDAGSGANRHLTNSQSLQVLDGSARSRIALEACMEKTILVKWPVNGTLNAYDSSPAQGLQPEVERYLLPGDLIKVTLDIPVGANTVDVYCWKHSVTIGGIGEPIQPDGSLPDYACPCIDDTKCPL